MRAIVASIVATLLVASTVRADEPTPEDAALVHLDLGVAAFHAKDYARAHREFLAAHELAPDRANPYRWLALTEVQLGQCPTALGNIEEFLARVKPDDPRIDEMTRLRAMCERVTAAPAPKKDKPITQKWWFWTAIGGAAVAIAGVSIAIATSGDDLTTLPPVTCGASGCSAP
jgi:hypothetical protein